MNKLLISNILIFGSLMLVPVASWGMFVWTIMFIPEVCPLFFIGSFMSTSSWIRFVKKSLYMQLNNHTSREK